MKKVCLLFSLLFISILASAQITWNCKAGAGIANLRGNDMDGSMKFGWKIGVGIEKPLTSNWLIMPSLEFKQKGSAYSDTEFGESETLNLSYLQLPIMGAYRTRLSDALNLTLKAGPYFAYALSGKADYDYGGDKGDYDFFDEEGGNRFDCGLAIGADFEYHRFVVGVEAEFGFVSIFKKDDIDGLKAYNTSAYITLGYKF